MKILTVPKNVLLKPPKGLILINNTSKQHQKYPISIVNPEDL